MVDLAGPDWAWQHAAGGIVGPSPCIGAVLTAAQRRQECPGPLTPSAGCDTSREITVLGLQACVNTHGPSERFPLGLSSWTQPPAQQPQCRAEQRDASPTRAAGVIPLRIMRHARQCPCKPVVLSWVLSLCTARSQPAGKQAAPMQCCSIAIDSTYFLCAHATKHPDPPQSRQARLCREGAHRQPRDPP